MSNDKSRKRVEDLFAGMQQLAVPEPSHGGNGGGCRTGAGQLSDLKPVVKEKASGESDALLREAESLRARVRERHLRNHDSEAHVDRMLRFADQQ